MSARKTIKKCHYEVLGVEQTATDDVIRKAYKVLALKYHPDKNMDNLTKATEIFRSVQEAYEVLTNPQERAWYDKHRTAILAGIDKDSIADSCFDVFPYFTASCYSGYDDSEGSFYSVYREVFDQIIKEDIPYYEEDYEEPVSFGNSETSYEQIRAFYAAWESYSTPKTFAFLDVYKTLEAPNRRVLRLMEKENKKVRDAAKKKRNDEIRALVAFVKRRDKRVDVHKKLVEVKLEEKRKKSAEHRKKQLEERRKEAETYKESGLFNVADLEDELKNLEENCDDYENGKKRKNKKKNKNKQPEREDKGEPPANNKAEESAEANEVESKLDGNMNDGSDYEELEDSDLYCVACEKLFKSVKSFANHENSKKHKSNVAALKALMEEEDQLIHEDTDPENDLSTNGSADESKS